MIEILAPAGDLISLKSAIASDTDAVYLGLSAFNARIKAENFTTENIKDTVDYCHLFGVKVYVTINIAACNRADCFTPKKRRENKVIFCRLPTYALPKI